MARVLGDGLAPELWGRYVRRPARRKQSVTVCIAAICTLPNGLLGLVALSDRMLTAGDIEFEPPQQKVYHLQPQMPLAAILVAGDLGLQAEICQRAHLRLAQRQSGVAPLVEEVAALYAEEYVKMRQSRAELVYLSPLGLTLHTFVANQRFLAPEQIQILRNQLTNYQLDAAAIVCGVDVRGAHIYTVRDPGLVSNQGAVGFDAIGIGEGHAASQFMQARYWRGWPLGEALLHAYSAKRRAETAPGVGKETDLLFIEPGGAGIVEVSAEIRDNLELEYKRMRSAEKKAASRARVRMQKYIDDLITRAAQAQGAATTPAPGRIAVP